MHKKVYGLFGKIKLEVGTYLILIENASMVGEIFNSPILRVESLLFIPIHITSTSSTEIDKQDQHFVDMIQRVQKDKSFYFSY